jgi:hypothetical protein
MYGFWPHREKPRGIGQHANMPRCYATASGCTSESGDLRGALFDDPPRAPLIDQAFIAVTIHMATVRWPLSLKDPDVLFLIPVPWFSPVWFPLLVSGLAVAAVLLTRDAATKPQ